MRIIVLAMTRLTCTAFALLVSTSAASIVACTPSGTVAAPTIEVPAQPPQVDAGAVAIGRPPAPSEPEQQANGAGLVGRWTGIGTQDDGLSWPINVDLFTLRPGVCAHVDYPSIPCRADWICTAVRKGELDAREQLLEDSATRCVDNGTMTMRLDVEKDELEWSWEGSGQTASGRLRRMP